MLSGAQHAHLMYDQRKHKEKTEKLRLVQV